MNDFIQNNGLVIATAWITREIHIWGPSIKAVYPYIKSEGGVLRIALNFIWVKQPKQTTPPQ